MLAAAVTFVLAIPANNTHWRVEIVKRGGETWYFDRNGRLGWMWTVEPISDIRRPQPVMVVPSSQQNPDVSHERL